MAPTKAMARYAVTTLSLPTNVMTLLHEIPIGIAQRAALRAIVMVNRTSPLKKAVLLSFTCGRRRVMVKES
jgi:hypothetical protein